MDKRPHQIFQRMQANWKRRLGQERNRASLSGYRNQRRNLWETVRKGKDNKDRIWGI